MVKSVSCCCVGERWLFSHPLTNVTGFVKIDPNHTRTEIHFIAEH